MRQRAFVLSAVVLCLVALLHAYWLGVELFTAWYSGAEPRLEPAVVVRAAVEAGLCVVAVVVFVWTRPRCAADAG
ncbi:MAG: hypothetical protein AB7O97_07150 [Planctomycetota bacterium]